MVATVFSAPVSFFDANPSGQLLSRFGKELESVDRGVPDGFGSVLYCFIQIFITIIGLSSVSPGMILPISLAGLFYISTMSKFRPAARDLKIFESKSRSPIYTHFGEALRGVEAIRSFSHSPDIWSSRLKYLTDENIGVYSSLKALDRWLSIRLEGSGNLVVLAAAVTSIFLTRAGRLKAGSAGWGLTQTLAITGLLTWAVRVVIDLESQMMSVMRVAEVSNIDISGENSIHVPCEKEKPGEALKGMLSNNAIFTSPSNDCSLVNSGWPWRGEVKFRNVSMRYNSASPRVLKNVTIDIAPGNTLVRSLEITLFICSDNISVSYLPPFDNFRESLEGLEAVSCNRV
jgi:ABC-type multidrug transport system fused ATPase/permease subunit